VRTVRAVPGPDRERRGAGERQTAWTAPAMAEPLSLLWPPGHRPARRERARLDPQVIADLDLDRVTSALSGGETHREPFVRTVLAALCPDPAVITYRAATLTDLLETGALRVRLQQILPTLTALLQTAGPQPEEWVVHQVIQRLRELTLYVEAAVQLHEALTVEPPRAPALRALQAHVESVITGDVFVTLQAELPTLHAALACAGSITIGVNLGADLEPESAAILALSEEKISGRMPLLERLLGGGASPHSLTPLRAVQAAPVGRDTALARDLRALLERVTDPVRRALDRYLSLQTQTLCSIEPELGFLLHSAALFDRLREAGLPVCRPEPAPIEQRSCALQEGYNLALALRMLGDTSGESTVDDLVMNPVVFDAARGRVWILTGPNRGGKTVYARSVGLAHVLFQAGLYVPARAAAMSPVDAIYTHFPTPERGQPGMGKLDEEAAQLAAIFHQASPQSLILLNEVLAGTNAIEGLALALDVVRGLRLLGARAIYVTHLHALAERVDEINAQTAGDAAVGSLVAEVESDEGQGRERRTFRIRPGSPQGTSYASTIAQQHGISFPQLAALLRERGILPPTSKAR
jgi:DNA mismatch repair protein MutS